MPCFLLVLLCFLLGCLENESSKADKAPATISKVDSAEMVLIPAGEFVMGNDDEKTAHTVYLDAYYIDKYPVTNLQYKEFIEATGYMPPLYWNNAKFNQSDHPVVGISWENANAYARWAGKRLPTEAEWEKSARGDLIGKKYPWGDKSPDRTIANFGGNEGGATPVGKYPPNSFDLYDMAGNVFNLCSDIYQWNYYKISPKSNPKGGDSGAYCVLRGGSWRSIKYYLRCSSRYDIHRLTRSSIDIGFRCAISASKKPDNSSK